MFDRVSVSGRWFHVYFGLCCCFCVEGSGVTTYAAAGPLGPFTATGQIGRSPANYTGASITNSQNNFIFPLPLAHFNGGPRTRPRDGNVAAGPGRGYLVGTFGGGLVSDNRTWVYNGDAWQSAPDRMKGHDFSRFALLHWDDSVSPPRPLLLVNSTSVQLPV